MTIRSFTRSDFPAILDIYAHSKLDELIHEKKTFKLIPLNQDEKRLAQLKASDIYVYEVENNIIAYGAVFNHKNSEDRTFNNEIRALFVHPHHRKQGIAQQLLKHLLKNMNGSADLYVAKSNQNAKALYEKFGFEISDEFETEYGGVSVIANKMTLHIHSL